jgi:serine phosphatase RsbU (regulator of sigma subunit)
MSTLPLLTNSQRVIAMLQSEQPHLAKSKLNISRLYYWGAGIALAMTIIAALIISLLSDKETGWKVWVQVLSAAVVFGFIVVGDRLTVLGKLTNRQWFYGAAIAAVVVFVASFFTSSFVNVLLAPLLVGLGQRYKDNRLLVYSSTVAVILIFAQKVLFWLIGWNYFDNAANGTITAIVVISSLALSLTTLVRSNTQEVEGYRLELENKASEMEVAHEIQTSLMAPNEIVTGDWYMAARSLPALDVGGDFYEYIPYLDKGIGGIAIGDVAGKGIPAALQMAVVRTLFRVEARRRIFPAETLQSVNSALQAERSFGMVTMLYAFVDPATSILHVANAGHNFPIILDGDLEEIVLPGLPLGIDDAVEYDEVRRKIKPGSSVILYTDGVVEAMNADGEMYGYDNFADAILRYKDYEPREMVDALLKEIADFTQAAPQSDDITVLVLQHQKISSYREEEEDELVPVAPLVVATAAPTASAVALIAEDDEDNLNWI